jgi:hypothetical protein
MDITIKEANEICISAMLADGLRHTAQELADYAMIKEGHDSCPITRAVLLGMIIKGELIGSTAKGYKLMDNGKEVQQCLNSLLRRQMAISRRIQVIYNAAQAKGIL